MGRQFNTPTAQGGRAIAGGSRLPAGCGQRLGGALVPPGLVTSLTEAAHLAEQLDQRMEALHAEVRGYGSEGEQGAQDLDEQVLTRLWDGARRQYG